MDGMKANLVITDPPYNVAYESADGKTIQIDSMADEKFYAFLLSAFRNMAAHMAEGGSAYIFHADTEGLNFRRAFKESGFHISGVCIWVKNSLVLGRSPYQWQHESILNRETFEAPAFKMDGGFTRFDKKFDGKLADLIRELNTYIYEGAV